jgi:drug/metabolite transporter (DMT)-like permease
MILKSLISRLYNNAYMLVLLAILFWAGNFVMGRGVADTIPPMILSCLRWLLASVILLPFAWHHLKTDWPEIRGRIPYFFLLGLLSGAAFNALTYLGLHTTTATNAFVINAALPIFIILLNFMMHGTSLSIKKTFSVIISLIGVLLIICKGDLSALINLRFTFGDLMVTLAMISWAIYTALLPGRPKLHSLSFAAMTFITATIILIPFTFIEFYLGYRAELNLTSLGALLYVGIFPGLLAYIFYNRGVELIGGNTTGILLYLMTPIGALLSILFLDEIPQAYHYIGFALILAGVIISSQSKPKQKDATKQQS